MAEKLTRKEKIALQKKDGIVTPKQSPKIQKNKSSLKKMLALLVAVAGFLLYSNTFGNDYVLDDFGLMKDNTQTKQGIKAIPDIFKSSYRYGMNITDYQLYRPLSKAMFAVEWNIAPNQPALGHWINVLLFSLLCYVLFLVLNQYLNSGLLIPFIASLLYAAHPLHTEVIANIKGRDEIVCFLLCLATLYNFHNYISFKSKRSFAAGTFFFFLALFSKESAVTFLAIVPLFFYYFTSADKKTYINTFSTMAVCTIIFLLIRRKVLGHVETLIPVEDNSLAGIKDFVLQKVNAIYILGVYLKLMIFPAPLISDGSYNHFPPIGISSWKFIIPFLILVPAAVYAVLNFKKKDIISFAIIYFFVTASIVSNVIILIGTNYGERLMFVPSLSVCLIAAVLISKILKAATSEKITDDLGTFYAGNSKPLIVVFIIVVLFGFQTIARNAEWRDNYTLYTTDVEKVPDSAHMLFYLANHITTDDFLASLPDSLSRMKKRLEAVDYLTRSVTIFPKYSDGYQRRGFIYNQLGKPDLAEKDYKEALKYNPTHPIVFNNYGTLCFDHQRYDEALKYFQQAVRYSPQYAHAWNNMASVYGVYGMGETEMITKDPANRDKYIAGAKQNFEAALGYYAKSIESDPGFAEPYRLSAVTYRNLGDEFDANKYEMLYRQVSAKSNAKN